MNVQQFISLRVGVILWIRVTVFIVVFKRKESPVYAIGIITISGLILAVTCAMEGDHDSVKEHLLCMVKVPHSSPNNSR